MSYEVQDWSEALKDKDDPYSPEWMRRRVKSDEDMVRWALDVQADSGEDEIVQEAARAAFERILAQMKEEGVHNP